MLVEFFSRGTGRGSGPVNYCLAKTVPVFDPNTRRRSVDPETGEVLMKTRDPAPTIMAGDPARTEMLINASLNKWKYTSGVIAFADEDAPTESEQREVMADFELAAFAGLDREQYDILWVRHEHEGNVELHFVVPRMELRTGKALNIAPPGYQNFFDVWRDSWNYRKGWASPSDPARARLVTAPDFIKKLKAPDAREQVTDWLVSRIQAGLVSDRAGIVASLEEIGQITRQGKDYVSVKPEGFSRAIRLKGAIYAETFNASELVGDAGKETGERPSTSRAVDDERVAEVSERLKEAIKRRAEFNLKRYRIKSESTVKSDAEADQRSDRADESGFSERAQRGSKPATVNVAGLDEADADRPVPLGDYLFGQLGADALLIEHDSDTATADRDSKNDTAAAREPNLGSEFQRGFERAVFGFTKRSEARDWLDSWRQTSYQAWGRLRGLYDRARKTFDGWIAEAIRTIQAGRDAAAEAKLALAGASAGVIRAGAEIEQGVSDLEREADRAIGVLKMRRSDELNRFKTDINLVEYAQSNGYEIDAAESSRSSVVMRNGSDKIIVSTELDGHGVYFSVRDNADNGTIIDFVQRRQGLNLGQVRKVLRPWIGGGGQRRQVNRKPLEARPYKPEPSSKDRQQVLSAWMRMRVTGGHHPYLQNVRKLSATTLTDKRFADHVRIDERGNAVFPHYDLDGLAGYELKNEGFTGFSRGGTKALWRSANLGHAPRVVLVEAAIDAMSHAQLTGDTEAAYVSTGGSMSDSQRELMRQVIERSLARGAEVVIATDSDEPGRQLARELVKMVPEGVKVYRSEPQSGKDWNDELRATLEHHRHYDAPGI